MVRAKFTVQRVEKREDGGGTVWLQPVVDGSEENKAFYKWTPGGQIILSTINEDALGEFEVSKSFYVDFTPATAEGQ